MFFDYLGAKLYYETVGEGKDMLMLHGFPCDHRLMSGCMEPVFEGLLGYRRVYLDLPGMGRSEAPEALASADAVLDCLTAFVKAQLHGPFLLAGESYGGYLAQGLLTRVGGQVDGLLLICPVAVPEQGARKRPSSLPCWHDEAYLAALSEEERRDFCEFAVVADRYTHQRYRSEVLPGVEAADGAFCARLEERYGFSFDLERAGRDAGYDRPVLLLAGRQDGCVGYEDQWGLLERYPRASFAVLDRAGHNLQLEQPELFTALVREWLRRTEG